MKKQDLSPDRIARLILHILFLEYSKSVTLILTWPVCVCVCVCVCGVCVCVCGVCVGGGGVTAMRKIFIKPNQW